MHEVIRAGLEVPKGCVCEGEAGFEQVCSGSKTHTRLKERFLIDGTGQNVQIFDVISFASYVQYNRKQLNQLIFVR